MIHSLKTNERGQALIELALALPILLLILMGIIEFGRIFHTNIIIEQAARAGGRLATVNQNSADIAATVVTAGSSLSVNANHIKIYYCPTPDCTSTKTTGVQRGDSAVVEITYPMELITPIIRPFVPTNNGKYEVKARMVMRVE